MAGRRVNFGVFEADLDAAELRKNGTRLHLQEKPFQILGALLERPGELITRDELRQRLWAGDTFVDFDHGLNVAINKLRETLGDSASNPRYVETVPRRGYRFIGSIRSAIAETAPMPEAPEPALKRRLSSRKVGIAAAASLLVALSGAAVIFWDKGQPALIVTPLSAEAGQEQEPSISPDGAHVAYVADPDGQLNYDIYVRSVGVGRPRQLTATSEIERNPAWSPDGRFIAFLRYGGMETAQIILIPALGGPERVVASVPMTAGTFSQLRRLLSWFPDGKRLVYVEHKNGRSALGVLNIESGERQALPDPPQPQADADPAVSPNGRRLVFARSSARASTLFLVDLTDSGSAAGEPQALTADDQLHSHPAWTPNGREILFAAGAQHFRQLYRVAASGGTPRQLPVSGGFHTVWPAVNGSRLVYYTGHYDVNLWRTPLANGVFSGPAEKIANSNYIDHMPEFSPDGRRLAFISNRSGFQELWVGGARGEDALQVTNYRGREVTRPVWSPGGDRIGFSAGGQSFAVDPHGGAPTQLFSRAGHFWSGHGSSILIGGNQISRVALRNGRVEGTPVPLSTQSGNSPRESPDGQWIYFSRGSEGASLWRVPATGGQETLVVEVLSNSGSWTVTKEGIWFIPPASPAGRSTIELKDAVTGRTTTVAPVARRPMWGLTVCPDLSCVIHTQADRFESDLMMVEGFR